MLGSLLQKATCSVDLDKVVDLSDKGRPKTQKQLVSLLAFINYLHNFILSYNHILGPLKSLRPHKKITEALWLSSGAQASLENVIAVLKTGTVLHAPDPAVGSFFGLSESPGSNPRQDKHPKHLAQACDPEEVLVLLTNLVNSLNPSEAASLACLFGKCVLRKKDPGSNSKRRTIVHEAHHNGPMRMQQTSRKGSSLKEIFGGPHCMTCATKSVSPAMPAYVTTSSVKVSTQLSQTQSQASMITGVGTFLPCQHLLTASISSCLSLTSHPGKFGSSPS